MYYPCDTVHRRLVENCALICSGVVGLCTRFSQLTHDDLPYDREFNAGDAFHQG